MSIAARMTCDESALSGLEMKYVQRPSTNNALEDPMSVCKQASISSHGLALECSTIIIKDVMKCSRDGDIPAGPTLLVTVISHVIFLLIFGKDSVTVTK